MKIRLPIRKIAPPNSKRPPKLKLKASVARSRRAPILEDEDDFLEEPEPNMKLSHAFVVVLVLHVIAVAGVFAFNSIKARQDNVFSAIKNEPAKTADAAPASAAQPEPAGAESLASAPAEEKSLTVPAAAPASAAMAAASVDKPGSHTLQPGETLTKVAAQFGVGVADLQKTNNITDPTKLKAGEVLVIPAKTAVPAVTQSVVAPKPAAPSTPETASSVRDSGKIYTVVAGDNPVKIAKKLHVSYDALMAINGNPDPRKLQIKQKLKIPASKE